MKVPLHIKSVGTKVSEEEFAALEATARAVLLDALAVELHLAGPKV